MKKIIRFGLISIVIVLTILNSEGLKLQVFQAERYHWADITSNPYIQEFTEEAWGQAGAVAYPAAAQWMRTHNGISQRLDETQKRYLLSYFGGLVDRVVVIYNAKLLDDWLYADFKIDIGLVDSIAQTYCERIYLEESYKPSDLGQLTLLSHELIHSKQCKQFGGADKFGYYYFREFKRAGQIYENNKLEKEANEYERQFAGWLSNEIANNRVGIEARIN
ncbi:hypothetical protein [Scytonema sp. UIC 10036]|uniref:hypothetical protein n=1 Tax=Scytonema sp. UIC 10036 TaxID=2304196 RepID=UPI001FAA3D4F|nr:hypothetical protein [Scytonema sp. UIC 10036]